MGLGWLRGGVEVPARTAVPAAAAAAPRRRGTCLPWNS